MKKYFVFGITLTIIAILVAFSLQERSSASMPSFWGDCKAGVTVSACMQPLGFPCYYAVANQSDRYHFPRTIMQGTYRLDNGCTATTKTYSGSAVRHDFCVPDPPYFQCPCE
jgi:hypothetical protein